MGEDSVEVYYEIPEEIGQNTDDTITIPIASKKMVQQLSEEEVSELSITMPLPDSILGSVVPGRTDISLEAELLKTAKELRKDITVSVTDQNGKERYSWTFTGDNLANSDEAITDVNLSLGIKDISKEEELKKLMNTDGDEAEDAHGLMLSFGHDGVLPAQASVRVYVGDQEGIKAGSRIYLYHYNSDTGKLETLPDSSSYVVDEDGYITVDILHCSDYVVLTQKAADSMITSLRNQIIVEPVVQTLYIGGTKDTEANIKINLPPTLELVSNLKDKTSQSAAGGVIVIFRSNKAKVVTVDSNGKVTAKGVGTATIFTTVTLYNGTTKTFKTIITVKKPYIKLIRSTDTMKVGST